MTFIDCLDVIVNDKIFQNYLSFFANIVAVIGIPISAYQIITGRKELKNNRKKRDKEERRKNQEIKVFLKEKDSLRKICLPNVIRRGELTRAEVLGRLGMIPILKPKEATRKDQPRFEIRQLVTKESISSIDALYVASEETELFINCIAGEMDQFDIAEIKKLGFGVWGFDDY